VSLRLPWISIPVLLAAFAPPSSAWAESAAPPLIAIEGEVVDVSSRWTADRGSIISESTIRATDGADVSVVQLGGTVEGIGMIASHHPRPLRAGQRVRAMAAATAQGGHVLRGYAPVAPIGPAFRTHEGRTARYGVNRTEQSGTPIYWASGCIHLAYDQAGSSHLPGDSEFAIIDAATAEWQAETSVCSGLTFSSTLVPDAQPGRNRLSTVVWREQRWCRPATENAPEVCHDPTSIAVTQVFFIDDPTSPRDGEIVEADIELNGVNFAFAEGGQTQGPATLPVIDLRSTVTHEIGHLLGLTHNCALDFEEPGMDHQGNPVPDCNLSDLGSEITEATMYFSQDEGETKKATLETEDVLGGCATLSGAECNRVVRGAAMGCSAAPAPPGTGGALLSALMLLGWARRRRRAGVPRRPGMSRGLVIAGVVAMAISAMWTPVHANTPRVVVNDFSGPAAERIRREVLEALVTMIEVVQPSDAVRAELQAGEISDGRMAEMAREAGFDALLTGTISSKRGKNRVILTLRAGGNGAEIEHFSVDLGRKVQVSAAAGRRIRQAMEGALAELAAIPVVQPQAPEGADSKAKDVNAEPADEDAENPISTPNSSSGNAAGEAGGSPRATPAVRRGVELAAGGGGMGRKLSFAGQDLDVAPYEYRSNPVPAARVQGEVYPGALLGTTGVFSNLGMSFAFERAFGMVSKVEGLDVNIPTTHQRWNAGLQVRVPLGTRHNSTTITVGGGYGQRAFYFDRTELILLNLDIDVPDVDYRAFDPGLAVRVPLGGRMALQLRGSYLLIRKVDDMDSPEWYGTATAYGADAEAAATLWVKPWLVVHAGVQYTRIDFTFAGNGARSDRDLDGILDVESALDEFYAGYLTAGLRF
jgi:MYXO-CTERM domain-containing protein